MNGDLGKALKRMRRLRDMKQAHLADLLGVTQSTVSRWERGTLPLAPETWATAQQILQSRPEPQFDAALRRLIESSSLRVHLVCDRTHRLLAASRPRQRIWRLDAQALKGQPMLRFASPEILAAESGLAALGWFEGELASLVVLTGANTSDLVRIAPGRCLWERIPLSDGAFGRLVTTLDWQPEENAAPHSRK